MLTAYDRLVWDRTFERWCSAINAPADRDLLAAAVTEDVVLERYQPGRDGSGELARTFRGIAEVHAWLATTAARSVFSLAGPIRDGVVEYQITLDDFTNRGEWAARTASDGRITHLTHRPYPLPPVTLPGS